MNQKYTDILKLARIQILVTILFIFFKLIRPSVLDSASPEFFKLILLSLPNFFEAIIGTLTLTGLGLVINDQFYKKYQIGLQYLYILVIIIAGIYVISQELNYIKLRTNTTMDPNDLIFSVIGLITGYGIILSKQPKIHFE